MGCWRSERSPPSTARWRRNWRFGSQRTASPETRRHCLNGIRRNFSLDIRVQLSQYLLLLIRFNESIHQKSTDAPGAGPVYWQGSRFRYDASVCPNAANMLDYKLSEDNQTALKRNQRGLR